MWGRYVLFFKARQGVEDYGLITGYELRDGGVMQIDGAGTKEGCDGYYPCTPYYQVEYWSWDGGEIWYMVNM